MSIACFLITHLPLKVEMARRPALRDQAALIIGESGAQKVVCDRSPHAHDTVVGMPLDLALARCPQAAIVEADMPAYRETWERVLERARAAKPYRPGYGAGPRLRRPPGAGAALRQPGETPQGGAGRGPPGLSPPRGGRGGQVPRLRRRLARRAKPGRSRAGGRRLLPCAPSGRPPARLMEGQRAPHGLRPPCDRGCRAAAPGRYPGPVRPGRGSPCGGLPTVGMTSR